MEITAEKKQQILNFAILGKPLSEIVGLTGETYWIFREYMFRNLDFKAELAQARSDGMEYLADSLLDIPHIYIRDTARTLSENIKWLLSKRKPQVYGDKLQLEVHTVVDVKGAISEAKQRVIDVTPMQRVDTLEDQSGYKPVAPPIKKVEVDIFS